MVNSDEGDLGPDDQEFDADNRVFQHMSLRGPAFVVLGIAVLIVVVGVVASAVDSGGAPVLALHSVTIADDTVVQLTPATTAMKSVVSAGQPPADILGNLAVPAGSKVTGTVNTDQNQVQYDRTVDFQNGLSTDQVVSVFRTALPKLNWQVIYVGSSASHQAQDIEVLAKKGSGDGYYWEVGVVVSPTTSAGVTPYSVELFEIPDDN